MPYRREQMMRRCRDVHIDNCWWDLSSACIASLALHVKAFDPYGVEADWQLPIRTILASCVWILILDKGPLKRERLLPIKLLILMVLRLYGNFCVCIHHR